MQLPYEEREYWKLKKKITRSNSVENSLWKELWIGRKTDNKKNEFVSDFTTEPETQ